MPHIPPTESLPCPCGESLTIANTIDFDAEGNAYIVKRVLLTQ